MSKERYLQNKQRVKELYGIDPNDRRYNVHHLGFRNDFKEGRFGKKEETWGIMKKGYIDSTANLCPLEKEVHRKIHEKAEEQRKRYLDRTGGRV